MRFSLNSSRQFDPSNHQAVAGSRRPHYLDLGLSLHQYVRPHNYAELRAIHGDARPSAVFYVLAILVLYVLGLAFILIHYMNSSYGSWNWNWWDVWDEIKPARFDRGGSGDRNKATAADPTEPGNQSNRQRNGQAEDEEDEEEDGEHRTSPRHHEDKRRNACPNSEKKSGIRWWSKRRKPGGARTPAASSIEVESGNPDAIIMAATAGATPGSLQVGRLVKMRRSIQMFRTRGTDKNCQGDHSCCFHGEQEAMVVSGSSRMNYSQTSVLSSCPDEKLKHAKGRIVAATVDDDDEDIA